MKIKVVKEFQLSDVSDIKLQPGSVIEVNDNIGQKCIKAGVANELRPAQVKAEPEKSISKQAETAEKRTAKK